MAGRSYRFFSVTTEFMRANLRAAWACAQQNNRTLCEEIQLRQLSSMEAVQDGMPLKSQAANGHMTVVMDPGEGSAAPQEIVEMWENLLSRIGGPVGIGVEPATKYLTFCAKYGLNPNCPDSWPCPLPAPVPDFTPPTDRQVYDFVMCNLVPITEVMSDYFWLRIKAGLQLV